MRKSSSETASTRKSSYSGNEFQPSRTLKTIFYTCCVCNVLINMDHGIIPAATREIMLDMDISEFELGLLGSLVYLGLVAGSITASMTFQKYSAKRILLFTGFGNVISLFIFPTSSNLFFLCMSRICTGYFQVFFVIYFPVWIDIHGKEMRTKWLTVLQMSVVIGIFLGYAVTAMFVQFLSWHASFYLQIMMLIACLTRFVIFKEEDVSAGSHQDSASSSLTFDAEDHVLPAIPSTMFIATETNQDYSLADSSPTTPNNGLIDEDTLSGSPEKNRPTLKKNLRVLWKNEIYRYEMLSLTCLYFVVTGLQFWVSDYWRIVLHVEKETVFLVFSMITCTGPTLGVVLGGLILDKFGGYTGKHAVDFILISGLLSSISGIPTPFLEQLLACGSRCFSAGLSCLLSLAS
jgi:MFS transporter, Spinster family, sphingosine-1-phosphate transporter